MPIPEPNASINPEADRVLSRIALRFGLLVFALLIADTLFVSYFNARLHPRTLRDLLTPKLAFLNGVSILVVLIPFYWGIYKLFAARLAIGRERVGARAWREAVAALEPFSAWMQRFLDQSGEAHFLLAQAYAGLGDKARAEAARAFVRRRKGVWADKLTPGTGVSGKGTAGRGKASPGKGAGVYAAPGQEIKPRPAKGKPKRRF